MERSELTDLLPADAAAALRRAYFLRLATLAAFAAAALVALHGLLLVPSYLYLQREIASGEARLAEANRAILAAGDSRAAARLSAVNGDATYLARLAQGPTAAGALRLALSVPHPGVTLSGFSYSADAAGETMRIAGTAATRESLRSYDLALSSMSWAKSVNLPISAYAEEKDISFAITVTGDFTQP